MNECTTVWFLWLLALLRWICCVLLWIPIGFHLLLSQSSLSWKWKQHWDLGVGCGGFPQGSSVFLTTTFENCARQLLGAKPWNNAASCQADLGWTFDASDRIAFEIASVRRKLWTLEGTIAGRLFRSSHVPGVPSWASISRQFLASRHILDWRTWVSKRDIGDWGLQAVCETNFNENSKYPFERPSGAQFALECPAQPKSCHSSPTGLCCIWARKRQEVQSQGPGMHLMSEEVFECETSHCERLCWLARCAKALFCLFPAGAWFNHIWHSSKPSWLL